MDHQSCRRSGVWAAGFALRPRHVTDAVGLFPCVLPLVTVAGFCWKGALRRGSVDHQICRRGGLRAAGFALHPLRVTNAFGLFPCTYPLATVTGRRHVGQAIGGERISPELRKLGLTCKGLQLWRLSSIL